MQITRWYTGQVDDDPENRYLMVRVTLPDEEAILALLKHPEMRARAILDHDFIVSSDGEDNDHHPVTKITLPLAQVSECRDFAQFLYTLADKEARTL